MNRDELLRLIDQAAREGWTKLDLSGRGLTELPPEVGQLTNLKQLKLDDNYLRTLPPDLGELTHLRVLTAKNNDLLSIPLEICRLTALTLLTLSKNQLTFLPSELGCLTNLTFLNLSNNQLTILPPELGQLSVLTSLYLSNNLLTTIPPEIGQLTALNILHLSFNRLITLPSELGLLTTLNTLHLSFNRLTALPPELGHLTALNALHLRSNQLTSLPRNTARLTHLETLDLRDNPFSLPPEILIRIDEPSTIIQAWLDYLDSNYRPLNGVKLALLGEGSVGKTSLVNRLLYGDFNPDCDKTKGVAIHEWRIAYGEPMTQQDSGRAVDIAVKNRESEIQVNVWDFGGQEIMHATHQFFLTKRTLYVLVLDNRLSETENRLDYWLTLIRSFGGDSPILVVGNKTDQHALDLDRRGLLAKYPTILAILETSCATGAGIPELRAAIADQIAAMPHVHDPIITTWFEVKAVLEALGADYIPYSDYLRLCQEKGVGNPNSQRILLGFLHDLGVILHFPDPRLETTNILNPEWVTQGVYRILNTRLSFAEPGILTWEMLARILDSEPYHEKQLFIVDMMQKFELCYEMPDRPHTYLIPDLLPKEARDTGAWGDALRFEVHYSMLPGSILTRLIVRMHRHIKEQIVWRTGVLLACDGNEALVRADLVDNRITIAVRGPGAGRRELLTRIREHMEGIHASLAGLEAAPKVPVPGYPQIPPVDYRWLRDMEFEGIEEFTPPGLTKLISVRQLLDGIESPSTRREWGAKYEIHVHGGQVGVIGDDADVDGGIHS